MSTPSDHKATAESADTLAEALVRADEVSGRLAGELERLGKGVERIAAKYGADHPEVADALHRLLRGRA